MKRKEEKVVLKIDYVNYVVSVVRELVVGMENRWNGPNRRRSKYAKNKKNLLSVTLFATNPLSVTRVSVVRGRKLTLIPQYHEIRLRAVRLCVHVALEWSSD